MRQDLEHVNSTVVPHVTLSGKIQTNVHTTNHKTLVYQIPKTPEAPSPSSHQSSIHPHPPIPTPQQSAQTPPSPLHSPSPTPQTASAPCAPNASSPTARCQTPRRLLHSRTSAPHRISGRAGACACRRTSSRWRPGRCARRKSVGGRSCGIRGCSCCWRTGLDGDGGWEISCGWVTAYQCGQRKVASEVVRGVIWAAVRSGVVRRVRTGDGEAAAAALVRDGRGAEVGWLVGWFVGWEESGEEISEGCVEGLVAPREGEAGCEAAREL